MRVAVATAVLSAIIALVLARGGDDGVGTTEAVSSTSSTTTEARPFAEQQIERIGNIWAPLFATAPNPDVCAGFDDLTPYREIAAKYMAQAACERVVCSRVTGPIKNCTPLSLRFQKSFAFAKVQDVAIKGYRAAAKFSNGEAVEFTRVYPVDADLGDERHVRLIEKVGGNAGRKFFK